MSRSTALARLAAAYGAHQIRRLRRRKKASLSGEGTVLETYRADRLFALTPAERPRYRARLRRLQTGVNARMKAAGWELAIRRPASRTLELGERDDHRPTRDQQPVAGVRLDLIRYWLRVRRGEPPRPMDSLETAMARLAGLLRGGERPVEDVERSPLFFRCPVHTLRRAKERLGVVTRREGFGKGGRYLCALPG